MSVNTKIEWCDHTFNPWIGCAKVSPGCAHCYAEALNHRWGNDNWGNGKPRRRTSADNWRQPVKWNAEAGVDGWARVYRFGHRPRVFCASMADWLDDAVPIEWLADLLKLIRETPNLDWLLLTKRPENFHARLESYNQLAAQRRPHGFVGLGAPPNVWIGTSVEDQQRADERIPEFLKIPARVRFLSVEPMLGPIDLRFSCFNGSDSFGTMPGIHWAIFGGESGPKARPCNIEWIRDGVRQCRADGVAPFVKQLGADAYSDTACNCGRNSDGHWKGPAACYQCGGRLNLKEPKGGDMSEWPEDLRVREFPEVIR